MMLRGLLCALLLLALPALAQAAPEQASSAQTAAEASAALAQMRIECTPAGHAAALIGKHGCVAGRVFRITTTRHGATHLSLCPSRRRCSFHVVVRARDGRSVGDLEYLHGKLIAVVGNVTQYRGHPRIVVTDKQQIQIAADQGSPEFDASRAWLGGKGYSRRHARAW
jgi:hypothetical protein